MEALAPPAQMTQEAGTKMAPRSQIEEDVSCVVGLKKKKDRADLIAYLNASCQ